MEKKLQDRVQAIEGVDFRQEKTAAVDRPDIGEVIRTTRQSKGLRLKDVSEASGLSISQLSKLENGRARLTVELALVLSSALEVPANLFFSKPGNPAPRGRRSVTRQNQALRHELPGMDFEVLCSDFSDKQNLNWRVTVHGKSLEGTGGLRSHAGEEFIHVLSGALTLYSEFYEPLLLSAGDSVVFDGEMAHGYAAEHDDPAVMLMSNSLSR